MNQDVTDYIEKVKVDWQADICKRIRDVVQEAIPDVQERIQYGKPHFLKNGKYAAVLGTAKAWVCFTIFNAADIDTPEGFFEESDVTERRTIKIREGQEPDYELLGQLLKQASDTI